MNGSENATSLTCQTVSLVVNGTPVTREIPAGQLLVDFLRDELNLTGSKEACGVGVCGLCTVLLDGVAVSSCLLPAACAESGSVWTIEGAAALWNRSSLLPVDAPNPALFREVQKAFLECEGMQCGICTSGQVMGAYALLAENPQPNAEEIRHHLAGNLCRCTGYESILSAVKLAAERWSDRK